MLPLEDTEDRVVLSVDVYSGQGFQYEVVSLRNIMNWEKASVSSVAGIAIVTGSEGNGTTVDWVKMGEMRLSVG